MNKKQVIGLVVAAALFIITGVSSVFTNSLAETMRLSSEKMIQNSMEQALSGGYSFDAPLTDYVAVVRVEGVIQQQFETGLFETPNGYQHNTTMDYIDNLMQDGNNVGILLYVDSPGGSVYESDELYQKLMRYKEATGRPVWGYMAHYAASGGYFVSAAADRIYANPNTVTGSIGVIMSGLDMTGLYEKLGIRYISITSGENKDSSRMTEEQLEIYQSQVDECYERFVEVVARGRDMEPDEVKKLADGRTYTAKQALANGLVDDIGLYEDVQDLIVGEAGTATFYELESTAGSMFSSLFGSFSGIVPKSEAQVLRELAEETHGGLQYYANGLQ